MPKGAPKNKPVTLYPLDFEQAVRRVLQAPNPRALEAQHEQERNASGDPLEPPKKAPQSKKRG